MKGKKLSVYRADLPRTLGLVAALLPAVISTSAFARELRAADFQSEDDPTLQALRHDPAAAARIERIGAVE
jgi:hypothetical protein